MGDGFTTALLIAVVLGIIVILYLTRDKKPLKGESRGNTHNQIQSEKIDALDYIHQAVTTGYFEARKETSTKTSSGLANEDMSFRHSMSDTGNEEIFSSSSASASQTRLSSSFMVPARTASSGPTKARNEKSPLARSSQWAWRSVTLSGTR